MTEVTLFKNHYGTVQVASTVGVFPFVSGRFFTTDKNVEAHFKKLAENGEHGIYIDPQEATVDPDAATPMDMLRKKIIAEHEAQKRTGGDSGITTSEQAGIAASVVSTADSEINGGAQAPLSPEQKVEAATTAQSPALSALNAALRK